MPSKKNLAVVGNNSSARPPKIKEERFTQILETLYTSIIKNKGLFDFVRIETHAPQIKYFPGSPALLPEKNENQLSFLPEAKEEVVNILEPGTLGHRIWLWVSVHEDLQDDSDQVYRAHCKIFADHPEFYDRRVLDLDLKEFARILKEKDETGKVKYKVHHGEKVARNWQRCMKTLFEEFEGDPLVFLKKTGWSVESVYAWKMSQKKIRGYDPLPNWGRKLISLYFFYLIGLDPTYVFPDDAFPADLHAQALVIQTGCLDWGDKDVIYSAPFAEMIRKFVTRLAREKNWDILILGHAQWLQGSSLCNGCALNKGAIALCNIFKMCGGRVDTGSYSAGKWYKDGRVQTKPGEMAPFGLPTEQPLRLTRARKRKIQAEGEIPKTIPLFIRRK
jgi:hypothetical protein